MKILTSLLISFFAISVHAQVNTTQVRDSKVKSLLVHPVDKPLENAVIQLLGNEQLDVNFDYLYAEAIDFRYEVVMCDKYWNTTNLQPSEYLDRIGEHYFDDIQTSVNTHVQYVHYATKLPNDNLKFKLSGNYILKVYNDFKEELSFQIRFKVTEQLLELEPTIKQATNVQLMDTHQELDLNIYPHGFPISNAVEDLYVVYQQNNRTDNAIQGLKPSFITPDKITFDYEKENTFWANAEFHQFNFKNLRVADVLVQDIRFNQNIYELILKQDEVRVYKPYNSDGDLNGKFKPAFERPLDTNTDADYVMVFFDLKYTGELTDSMQAYVVGGFNNWQLNSKNIMVYTPETSSFQAYILLKQGYYDYAYAFVTPESTELDIASIEGSFYQTKNEYEIFIYYTDISIGYDRLIGYKKIYND